MTGILVHKRIPIINPYTAKASPNATTKKALKNSSGFYDRSETAPVPVVMIANPAPSDANPTAKAADNADIPIASPIPSAVSCTGNADAFLTANTTVHIKNAWNPIRRI